MVLPSDHTKIAPENLLALAQPLKNKYKIALFLFSDHSELEKVADMSCAAAYVAFSKPKNKVLGGILMSEKHKTITNIAHECSHATYDFMETIGDKVNLGPEYKKLKKKDRDEERFCYVLGVLSALAFEAYGNKTVV